MPRRQVSWYRTTCTPKRAGCTASATTAPPRQASWRRGQRNLKAAWALRWCRSVPISRQLRRQEAREDRDSKGDCREQESELCGKKKTKASGLLSSREAECGKRKSEFIQKDAHGSQHESQEAQKKKERTKSKDRKVRKERSQQSKHARVESGPRRKAHATRSISSPRVAPPLFACTAEDTNRYGRQRGTPGWKRKRANPTFQGFSCCRKSCQTSNSDEPAGLLNVTVHDGPLRPFSPLLLSLLLSSLLRMCTKKKKRQFASMLKNKCGEKGQWRHDSVAKGRKREEREHRGNACKRWRASV